MGGSPFRNVRSSLNDHIIGQRLTTLPYRHVSSTYSQPALLGIPTIPCEFTDDAPVSPHLDWSGTIGSARIFTAKCQGTVIFAKIAAAQMSHPGSTQDISSRMNIYKELNQWAQTLSPMACYPSGRVSEYHFLRYRPSDHNPLQSKLVLHADECFTAVQHTTSTHYCYSDRCRTST